MKIEFCMTRILEGFAPSDIQKIVRAVQSALNSPTTNLNFDVAGHQNIRSANGQIEYEILQNSPLGGLCWLHTHNSKERWFLLYGGNVSRRVGRKLIHELAGLGIEVSRTSEGIRIGVRPAFF